MKLLVYKGAFAVAEVLGYSFEKGKPLAVHPRDAKKILRNQDFSEYVPAPATEPVKTEPTKHQPSRK